MNFKNRVYQKEQLDDLSLSGKKLHQTLGSLKLINTIFGNHKTLSKSVLNYCLSNRNKKPFHIVDLGCGGGDSIAHIYKTLHKRGIKALFTGIDGNPESIAFAKANTNVPKNSNFIVADILAPTFSIPDADILISSHFIYHFTNDDLIRFLERVSTKKINHIIFSELYRSKIAYYLFKFSSPILPISLIAKRDGLLAIKRAFTVEELNKILKRSNLKNASVHKKLWFRTLTVIPHRPQKLQYVG
ncbi:class I SAM-dependent methyltransferase [Aquimarina addita]|uniref:Class I SAM-dependent methyltransferase n=1 Tax=Aquimarina addita TaxID=870485 RepID=A0ABP6UYI4_9FLAO